MRRRLVIAAAVGLAAVAATVVVVLPRPDGIRHAAPCRGPGSPSPVAGHPRLFVRAADLDRLRGWATDANPVYTAGLAQLAERAKADMDAGRVPGGDRGRDAYEESPTESYAELFAFLSLVTHDQAARDDYGRRACSLLMDIVGRSEARPPTFATFDLLGNTLRLPAQLDVMRVSCSPMGWKLLGLAAGARPDCPPRPDGCRRCFCLYVVALVTKPHSAMSRTVTPSTPAQPARSCCGGCHPRPVAPSSSPSA